MVVNENTESINILEASFVLSPSSGNVSHGLSSTEDILDSEIHGIIEETADILLIVSNVIVISIKGLTHLEDSSSLTEFFPELLRNVRNGINSNTIKAILLDKISNPVLKVLANEAVVLIEIREISKSAVFNLPLVAPILNITFGVIMLSFIEWID